MGQIIIQKEQKLEKNIPKKENKFIKDYQNKLSTSEITRGPINWWDDPKYKKENPNFNPETYLNNPVGNPNALRDIPKGMEPRLSKDKNGGWLDKYK